MRMISSHSRQPIESVFVLRGGRVAVIGFEQTDDVGIKVRPQSNPRAMFFDVSLQRFGVCLEKWHRQITRQNVIESWNISRALNGCMAPECKNPATRPADVSQQQLQ